MLDNTSNNKRIAKNTLLLYIRMMVIMIVGLYTSRIILQQLGVSDYGIFNVVGGFIVMFGLLCNSIATGISRYLTYEIGTGNTEKLKKIFSASVTIQFLLSLFILVLIEAVGIWFLNNKMNIPEGRMGAANWVLQLSAIGFCINLISIPYSAVIIAHEKMTAYSYISIFESILKLLICFALSIAPFDRLVFYSFLMLLIAIVIRVIYGIYCRMHFDECKIKVKFEKELFKDLLSFSGWNFIGAGSAVLRDYGVNILLNIFYGTTVNAARGIAMQVSSAVQSFSRNFIIAINPQITKNYAAGNLEYTLKLVFWSSRVTFYLLFLLAFPFFLEAEFIVKLWLGQTPEYTIAFIRLVIIYVLSECISYTMVTLMLATGNIKWYQIIVGGCQMLNFPICYFILKLGAQPEWTMVVAIAVALACLALRLYMLKGMVGLPVLAFVRNVLCNVLLTALLSLIIPLVVFSCLEPGMLRFVLDLLTCFISTLICILYVGCSHSERQEIDSYAKKYIKKCTKR